MFCVEASKIYNMRCSVPGIPNLNLPDVCTSTPAYGNAFCEEHCELLHNEAPDFPTDFLKHCKTNTEGIVQKESQFGYWGNVYIFICL